MPERPLIYLYRQDLRLADHPALTAAVATGRPVIPVYISSPQAFGSWAPGGASRWWLHHSLAELGGSLAACGSQLILKKGSVLRTLEALRQETGADAVYWQRRYEPGAIAEDTKVKLALREAGWQVESFPGALLHEPWTIRNKSGKPFQVFTPFWKHCQQLPPPEAPLPAPTQLHPPAQWPASMALAELNLRPKIPWDTGMQAFWKVGETAAHERLLAFANQHFNHYAEDRNRPDLPHTSRLSPYLHHGQITPRQIYATLQKEAPAGWNTSQFVAEIGWREFSHHLLFHFPHTPEQPLRPEWQGYPADANPALLAAWQQGRTGFPIVDAGMRELWETGWMHNRVRMIVASFLVKDLFLPWQAGAAWFWDTLVDADLAANTMGWQWSAGCGADAAPYFRVFNPTTQGEKFDPEGHYIRRYIPELARLPSKMLHRPHEASPALLSQCGVVLGKSYPHPIVDHASARQRALSSYANWRQSFGRKS